MVTWTKKTLVIVACAFAVAPALAAERAFDKHFDVPQTGRLTLDTDVGSVAVVGREGHDVVVHADVSGSGDFLARMDIKAVQSSDGVTVTGRVQQRTWFDWWFWSDRQKVLYTIDVPPDYPLDINTSGGWLDVRSLNASVRGKTGGGSVTVRDVHGSIDLRTSGGRIDAAKLSGPTQLHSSRGSIEVTDSAGDLDVSTSGGAIRLVGVNGRVRAVTSGGRVEAEIRANKGVSLATSGGNIALLLPPSTHGSIDAHTSGGRVKSTIPLTSTEIASHSDLRGTINGGGDSISLRTSGGSIQISARLIQTLDRGPRREH